MKTILDIETAPQDRDVILANLEHFDREEVKVGNIKDPEKIKAHIDAKEQAYYDDAVEKAALFPTTGTLLATCVWSAEKGNDISVVGPEIMPRACVYTNETAIVRQALEYLSIAIKTGGSIITYNGSHYQGGFDVPFILGRALILGVSVNISKFRYRKYWKDNFIDIKEVWEVVSRREASGGIDGLAKILGCKSRKNGDGKSFHQLYKDDPQAAIGYCLNELELHREVAERLGVL